MGMPVSGDIAGPRSHRQSPRWLSPAAWMVLFGAVLFGPQWLATAAVVLALCWVAARALVRFRDPSVRAEEAVLAPWSARHQETRPPERSV
jgi:hypothetical protein